MGKNESKGSQFAARASKVERLDAALATVALRHRGNPAVKAVGLLSEASDQPPLLAASAATLAAGLVLRQPRLARAGLRMLASELVATGIKAGIKRYVARTRPHKMLEDGRYLLHPDKNAEKNEGPWNSFPSGHTAGAVAVGRALSREYPQASSAAAAAAAAVGLVQLPQGNHFASDVVVGAMVGWVAEAAVNAAVNAGSAAVRKRGD
ncbi:phosphatase PAP2 family protein [Sphingomonas xinjiangensis]|uniref:Membrane-associated phospholipid phosphatase n=1 Tax=Sphingomonas xinjiangensis TaxID=643568 RepID=A0A840YQ48_9SPHN|nr:phosphatase PAP2 family protein [Sphingomonas xinjiangensis]MBB5710073.1 membrane-associated phospholipid phosphatase [Sphingomonas xinjiangensis]